MMIIFAQGIVTSIVHGKEKGLAGRIRDAAESGEDILIATELSQQVAATKHAQRRRGLVREKRLA
jgi:hypothetical protein